MAPAWPTICAVLLLAGCVAPSFDGTVSPDSEESELGEVPAWQSGHWRLLQPVQNATGHGFDITAAAATEDGRITPHGLCFVHGNPMGLTSLVWGRDPRVTVGAGDQATGTDTGALSGSELLWLSGTALDSSRLVLAGWAAPEREYELEEASVVSNWTRRAQDIGPRSMQVSEGALECTLPSREHVAAPQIAGPARAQFGLEVPVVVANESLVIVRLHVHEAQGVRFETSDGEILWEPQGTTAGAVLELAPGEYRLVADALVKLEGMALTPAYSVTVLHGLEHGIFDESGLSLL